MVINAKLTLVGSKFKLTGCREAICPHGGDRVIFMALLGFYSGQKIKLQNASVITASGKATPPSLMLQQRAATT